MTEFCYICDKFDFRCGGQACVVVVVGVGGGGGRGECKKGWAFNVEVMKCPPKRNAVDFTT